MSMTRKEALNKLLEMLTIYPFQVDEAQAIGKTLEVLRTPTREQVERMRGGPEFEGGTDWYHCSKCGVKETGVYVQSNFCSICGQPKTDKAVDIIMKKINNMEEMINEH